MCVVCVVCGFGVFCVFVCGVSEFLCSGCVSVCVVFCVCVRVWCVSGVSVVCVCGGGCVWCVSVWEGCV